MPGNIGLPEIAIVLVIALLVFGPKRLPELGKSLGNGIREFKGSISGENDDDEPKAADAIASPPTAPPDAAKAPESDAAKAPEDEPVAHDRG
jgi:sec-independent protein translocase protein TatA